MHNGLKIVGGSLLAAWMTLNPAHALGEEKNDGTVNIPQTTPPGPEKKFSVPMVDARTNSVGAVQFAAVAQSDKGIVVVFYGQNRSLFDDTKEATREAISEGLPIRGMIFGPPPLINLTSKFMAMVYLFLPPISLGTKRRSKRLFSTPTKNMFSLGLVPTSLPLLGKWNFL